MEKAQQKLNALLALWHEKRGKRQMPSRDDLTVTSLRPWLGNLALIDLGGREPHFRLCGTRLRARFGGEVTRKKLDELDDAVGGKVLRRVVTKVRETLVPTQMIYEADSPGGRTVFLELCAPLARDGEHIDMVLFASYAGQKR